MWLVPLIFDTQKGWIMESFATPYPVLFFDGEQDHEKGHVGVHSALTFKRFQTLMSQKTGIPANQLSSLFVCKKTSKDTEKRQKIPINESTNFSIILNQHNPSKEKDCHFLVSMKKSKKERKVSKKRSADAYNNGDDDEADFSPDASLSPVSHMDWSSPLDSGSSEGSGNISPANEMVADAKVELTSSGCPDTVQPGFSTERPVLDDANAVLPAEGSEVEIEIKNESSNSSSVPKFSQPMNFNSQYEGQRKIVMQAIEGIHFESSQMLSERTIGQRLFHSQFNAQMPHAELFNQERYSDAVPQVSHLRPNISLVRNGAVSSGYATPFNRASALSPSFSLPTSSPLSTPFGARLPQSSISSAGFFPSRVPFHNAAATLGFTTRDISLQRIQAHLLQVQQREAQVRVPYHDLLRYSNGFCNWLPSVTVHEDQQHSICEVCYDCKRRNVNPTPFHWCVQDRITLGFRGPSPAGPIERPGKRRIQVAV